LVDQPVVDALKLAHAVEVQEGHEVDELLQVVLQRLFCNILARGVGA
jgi:hypothetical protein